MFFYLVLGCNILAVLLGTAAGCLLRRHISDRLRENTMTYFAAISAALGLILTAFYLLSTYIAPYMTDTMTGSFLRLRRADPAGQRPAHRQAEKPSRPGPDPRAHSGGPHHLLLAILSAPVISNHINKNTLLFRGCFYLSGTKMRRTENSS